MSGPDEVGDDPFHSSDHPNEPDLPGEDNAGERLIRKYDPTIDEGPGAESAGEPDFGDVDVDDGTARMFWYLVFVFNVALMALAIGLMTIVFLDRWSLGGQITAAGAILTAYGYYRYRAYSEKLDSGDAEDTDADGTESDGAASGDPPADDGNG